MACSPTAEETAQQQAVEEQTEQAEDQPAEEEQQPVATEEQRAAQRQAAQRQQQQEAQRQRQAQEQAGDQTEDDSPAADADDDAEEGAQPQRRRAQFRSSDDEGRDGDRSAIRREDSDNDRADTDRGDEDDDGRRGESRQWETGIAFDTDPQERLLISELEDDAVLARAGLRRGDVILSINGRDITSEEDFLRWIHISRPDRPIAFVVWRDGAEEQLFVDVFRFDGRDEPRERNAQADDAQRATLGVVLDVRWDNAAVVESVFEGSPADEVGLRPGDQIVRFNGRRVGSPLQLIDLVAQHQPGDDVEIEIARRVTRSMSVALDAREEFGDEAVRYAEQPRQDRRLNDDRDDGDDSDRDEFDRDDDDSDRDGRGDDLELDFDD